MRLERVEISDYRSIFADGNASSFVLDLAPGMNTLVGPNNCGKSNVLRAVALALDPQSAYDPLIDNPGTRPFAYPIITLHMQGDDRDGDEGCLAVAEAYEKTMGVTATFASEGKIVLRVAYEPGDDGPVRRELLVVPGGLTPILPEQSEALESAIAELRKVVRFVLVSSGESIRSVLEGNFREILHSVVKEGLAEAFEGAERSRADYVSGIEDSLLGPLRDRLSVDVGALFPEIERATLVPDVPTIDRTLSNVRVGLEDLVDTPLSEKGTGVRGGVLIAMLSYLASNSNSGMIFALEEPEAFLHPAAQEDLRDRLEDIALESDVSLMVTTHSPFIVTNSPSGRIIALAKDNAGRTRISETAIGSADHAPMVAGLFRDSTFEALMQVSSSIPSTAEAVVLVEGVGDEYCLELAARVVGREDLLDGIYVIPAGGAQKVIQQAIVARASTDKPVIAVVDNDEPGLHAYKTLTGSTFGFKKKEQALTYAHIFDDDKFLNFPVEAEDLFDVDLIEAFAKEHGSDVVDGTKKRPDGRYHYDFGASAKELLTEHLELNVEAQHVALWLKLILRLRDLAQLPDLGVTVDELITNAPIQFLGGETTDGLVLVLTGKHDYARYQRQGVVVLDTTVGIPEEVNHIGFYADGEIKAEVPEIVRHYTSIRFEEVVVEQLLATGSTTDLAIANIISESLRIDDDLAGSTRQLLLLSDDSDGGSIAMATPIKNTKQSHGRPLAWAIAPRIVHTASLRDDPATTTELDALEDVSE